MKIGFDLFGENTNNIDILIRKLQGNSGIPKRYNGSPLRYPGGKSLAVGIIAKFIPNDVKKIVSPFIGGGSVEIAFAKELGLDVVGYDVFDLLVNYWNNQTTNGKAMYDKLKTMPNTKEEYERVKNILKEHWNKTDGYDGKLDTLDAAVYYYFNMQLSYGPGFLGWMSSIYEDDSKYKNTIEKVRDFYLPNLKVYNKRFEESIPENNGEFMYLDPPYVLDECSDSKMFAGIYPMRNFPIHHKGFDHEKLSELLHQHKGGFVMSYNDCSMVRELYSDFEIHEVKWQYTMGNGETRIGKNRMDSEYNEGNKKESHEVIIVGK